MVRYSCVKSVMCTSIKEHSYKHSRLTKNQTIQQVLPDRVGREHGAVLVFGIHIRERYQKTSMSKYQRYLVAQGDSLNCFAKRKLVI